MTVMTDNPHEAARSPEPDELVEPTDDPAEPTDDLAERPDDLAGPANDFAEPADDLAERAAELVTELTEAPQATRPPRRLIAPLEVVGSAVRSGARVTGNQVRAVRRRVSLSRGWLTAQVIAMVPRLRVRDQAALRTQFPGLDTDEIADALIERAARASATVGGAVGAWAALPALPAFPAEVVTETLALVGIEVKLVAELHEIYGLPATGNRVERMTAYLASWAQRRGMFIAPGGVILTAGSPLARQLQRRLAGRLSRSAFSLGPLFTGAVAGALLNRRETRRLGHDIRADLRRKISREPEY
jgi:hypothetical protein